MSPPNEDGSRGKKLGQASGWEAKLATKGLFRNAGICGNFFDIWGQFGEIYLEPPLNSF